MQCPVDGTTLAMADRQGVEIDYCPQCRGVWLDRGELDKLIDRSMEPRPAQAGRSSYDRDDDRYDDDYRDRARDERYGRDHRKRRGFLGELFDFD